MAGVVRTGVTTQSRSLFVHYRQAYVESGLAHADDFGRAVAGQANGLLGAQVPGRLFLGTGLYTGYVGLRIESHQQAPVLGEEWQDVAGACFHPVGPDIPRLNWGGQAHPFNLSVRRHRVRYCASGIDQAKDGDATAAGVIDSYLLQLWPEQGYRKDVVLRQGSAAVGCWHQVARADR